MVAKQLSIFLENKSGRLTEVTEVLAKEGVNLSALCIAENADFGILRGIVSEPDKAYKVLKDNHFAVNVTDVVGISCPNIPGSLAKVLRCLSDEGVFIEYMYSFANGQTANVIIRPNDMENCIRVFNDKKSHSSRRTASRVSIFAHKIEHKRSHHRHYKLNRNITAVHTEKFTDLFQRVL